METVTLISSDNIKFDVSKENIFLSEFVKNYFEDLNDVNEIIFPVIEKDVLNSNILKKVIEFCELQTANSPSEIDGTYEEIENMIKDHFEYHIHKFLEIRLDCKKYHILQELDDCDYEIEQTPTTYWYSLNNTIKENIRNDIIEIIKKHNITEISMDEYDDIWRHFTEIHFNGLCCHKDDTKEIIIPKWCEEFFETYKNIDTNLEDHILTKLIIAGDYLGIKNLVDFASKTMSDLIEDNFSDCIRAFDENEEVMINYRNFLGQENDINDNDKKKIDEMLKLLKQ